MSEKLPGAEYAPTINLGVRPSTLGDWEQVERRLSVRDPDDQRAIWRRAALALGATAEGALQAVLRRMHGAYTLSDGRTGWTLDAGRSVSLSIWVGEDTVEAATAALCARVWGPK